MRILVVSFIVLGTILMFSGCGGDSSNSGNSSDSGKVGGGKVFAAAMDACRKLNIDVNSYQEGQVINGTLPETLDSGKVLVNIIVNGSAVNIQFFNAPNTPGWQSAWKNKIINAIQTAGSKK